MNSPQGAEFIIVGAGLAGAAVAYQLRQGGIEDILVLEQEPGPAQHGSAQNAGMIRQHASNPFTAALARRGAGLHRDLQAQLPEAPPFLQTNSILVGGTGPELAAGYRAGTTERLDSGTFVEQLGLNLPQSARALVCLGDGRRDAPALCHALLEASGAQVLTNSQVRGFEPTGNDGQKVSLENGRELRSERLVICAGAWSRELLDLPLQPFRRHLFLLADQRLPVDAPWVWDLDGELYFRAHEEGLLLSACDELPDHPQRGQQPHCDDGASDALQQLLEARWPQLLGPRLIRTWAGLRVLSPDDGFVLGPDPRLAGLAWCTGLGGHGLTCALSASALALRPWLGHEVDLGRDPGGPEAPQLQAAHGVERLPFWKETWDA